MKRVKRRYLALRLDGDYTPSDREFLDAIWVSVSRLFGEYGASLTSLALINYDCERRGAILRANLSTMDNVRAALATITVINGKPVAIHVTAVSGTIKALREKSHL